MLTRKRQLAVKEESIEGTAETLLAVNAGIQVKYYPKATQPLHLARETAQAITHIAQSPESMNELIPEDSFSLKGLVAAAAKTGIALWQRRQQQKILLYKRNLDLIFWM